MSRKKFCSCDVTNRPTCEDFSPFYLVHLFYNKRLTQDWVLPLDMVDKSTSYHSTYFRLFFIIGKSKQGLLSWSEAQFECCCWHLRPSARDMRQHPHPASMPLKRKPAATGKRAPRKPSTAGSFCRLPWLESVADSVGPDVCPLVRAAV